MVGKTDLEVTHQGGVNILNCQKSVIYTVDLLILHATLRWQRSENNKYIIKNDQI